MQLTSPAFLLIFLPLALLLMLPVPKKHRLTALALLSALWYALANYRNPIGLGVIFILVLFAYAMVLPVPDIFPRLRLVFGTVLPLSLLLAARLMAEYGPEGYLYPYGLTFVTLGTVSAVFDRIKSDADRPRTLSEFVAYLLFFPSLLMGPLVRWKNYRDVASNVGIHMEQLSLGIRLYMGGTVKRIAVSAVLLRTLDQIISYCGGQLHYLTALLLPFLAFFCFYFFLSGCSDISGGIALMFGLSLTRDRAPTPFVGDPLKFVFGFLRSLSAYLSHYVAKPLSRRLQGRGGRVLAVALSFVLWVLFFRTRLDIFLFAAPLLLLLLICAPWKAVPRNRGLRLLLTFCSFAVFSLLALAMLREDPRELVPLFASLKNETDIYGFYYIYSAVTDTRYLLVGAIIVFLYFPFTHFRGLIERRCKEKLLTVLHYTELLLLFAGFLLTWVYFVPQFPEYTDIPYRIFSF